MYLFDIGRETESKKGMWQAKGGGRRRLLGSKEPYAELDPRVHDHDLAGGRHLTLGVTQVP